MSDEILTNEFLEEETFDNIPRRVLDERFRFRQNPFCVIAKAPWANGGRDLQTNSVWTSNPYGSKYAVVPDEMVPAMLETNGFCNIVLNDEGTEVISFSAIEMPVFEPTVAEPTQIDRIEAQVTYTAMMTDTLLEV